MSFVTIDIGASGTIVKAKTGTINTIPNNMVILNEGEDSGLTPYDNELLSALEVHIEKEGESDGIFPATFLVGSMAERYSALNIRPSVQENKHKQRINYLSIITAAAVSRIMNIGANETKLGPELKLYVAVPPVEKKAALEAFRKELVGKFVVRFPKYAGGATVDVIVTSLDCEEESKMSSVSFLFNDNGSVRAGREKFLSGYMLGVNIGASTTDIALTKNGKYLDLSGKTFPVGGNIARDYLIGEIAENYSFDLPVNEAEEVISDGRMAYGSGYIDVSKHIIEAKKVLSRDIVSRMEYYFKRVNVPIQSIKGVMVSGGGSLPSRYVNSNGEYVQTTPPMSEFVTEQLKVWCPDVEVVPYGDDARNADVNGLWIKASLDEAKERARAQVGAVTQ